MARLKNHLPGLGVLALAVAVAAVAYSVSQRRRLLRLEPWVRNWDRRHGGRAEGHNGHAQVSIPQGHEACRARSGSHVTAAGSARHGEAARGADFGGDTGRPAGPVLQPEQFHPPSPVTPRKSPSRPNSPDGINRELRRLIDGPKGRRPTPAPRRPSPRRPVAPTPTQPRPNAPVDGTPTAPPPTAPADGTTPTTTPPDPDAGLDDTPVGGLDPTDLGEPVDQTDTGAAPVPGTGAPTDTGTDTGAGPDAPIDIGPDTGG